MSRVIAAIDNSPAARPVLAMAKAVAPLFAAEVDAVHIVQDGDQTAESEAAEAGVTLRRIEGDPSERIAALVDAADVVAVVIGTHSRTVGRHAGHVPLALASSTDKPVIVVHPSATPPTRLRRVMVAIEGTPRKVKDLKRAIEFIESTGLEIIAVHVDDGANIPSFGDQVQHETEAYTREFFSRFLPGAPEARLELRIGSPPDEILAATEEAGAELLAVGWPQGGQDERGIVARELLERCRVPMLLVATT
jgi:nucleotide-binding universal stress UspA family protein